MAAVAVQTLLLGLDLGWTATEMRNGQVRLTREHDGRAVAINLPTNQRSIKQGVGESWLRKVVRYGDPLRVAVLSSMIDGWNSPDPAERDQSRVIMRGLRSSEVLTDPGALDRIMKIETPVVVVPDPEPEPEAEPEPDSVTEQDEPEQPTDEPHIVKVKPWVARHSMRKEGGEVYESKAVLERKWSDGSIDYGCPRCDFTNVEPRRVAAHYGGKHGAEHPAAQASAEMYVDPEVRWTPTERQKGRIHRLAGEMRKALEAIGPEMTVDECAEWIVKHRDEAREHLMDETTPLTDEQVLDRIRRLIDRGAYADLMARIEAVEAEAQAAKAQQDIERRHERLGAENAIHTLEQRLTEQEQAVKDANVKVEEAEARAQEMTDRWKALRDLVAE
jgi:hypothetical protein